MARWGHPPPVGLVCRVLVAVGGWLRGRCAGVVYLVASGRRGRRQDSRQAGRDTGKHNSRQRTGRAGLHGARVWAGGQRAGERRGGGCGLVSWQNMGVITTHFVCSIPRLCGGRAGWSGVAGG